MHIWTGGQNPDPGPHGLCLQDGCAAAAPPGAETSPSRIGARRNAFAQVSGRRFHSREDLYSQPGVGDMFSNLTASYDPVFWPIHVNVDRIWWEWQKRNPNGLPDDLDSVLSPWSYTIRDMLDIAPLRLRICPRLLLHAGRARGADRRFVSTPIKIDEKIKALPQGGDPAALGAAAACAPASSGPSSTSPGPMRPRRCTTIRITPAISRSSAMATATAARAIATCRRRSRAITTSAPRSHNTPRNHRIDVTQRARRLLETADSAADHAAGDRRRLPGGVGPAEARRRIAQLPRLRNLRTRGHLQDPSGHRHRAPRQQRDGVLSGARDTGGAAAGMRRRRQSAVRARWGDAACWSRHFKDARGPHQAPGRALPDLRLRRANPGRPAAEARRS